MFIYFEILNSTKTIVFSFFGGESLHWARKSKIECEKYEKAKVTVFWGNKKYEVAIFGEYVFRGQQLARND